MERDEVVTIRSVCPVEAVTETVRRHLLTFTLEDYYQAEAFREVIRPDHWYRFDPRIVEAARAALGLLADHGVRSTFFVSAWVADRFPDLIAEVTEQDHEVAILGEIRQDSRVLSPSEFREELRRGRKAVERASGTAVVGYRFAQDTLPNNDSELLGVLADEGFAYATGRGNGQARQIVLGESVLWLFPDSAAGPLSQARHSLTTGRGEVNSIPALINIPTWEFDPNQPRIEAIARSKRIRHYRNLGATPAILQECFATGSYEGIAESLGIAKLLTPVVSSRTEDDPQRSARKAATRGSLTPVSLVVPCYNEEPTVKYLANTLKNVRERLGDRFDLRFVFVDDGSTDGTWAELHAAFDGWSDVALVRHARNRGVAASILTGIRQSKTEVVCSIDCDCTYDPHELASMVPLLTPGTDLVTASPYHPLGTVRNVQGARLFLSKSASFLYRRVFRQKLFTYTSCFRVYRRSAVEDMNLRYPGFLGVVEILGRLDLQGARVVEYPTTLEVRVFGQSKMKLARTIIAHLGLLTRLLWTRWGHVSALSSGVIPPRRHQSSQRLNPERLK
jgi:hypothetical protein